MEAEAEAKWVPDLRVVVQARLVFSENLDQPLDRPVMIEV